MKEAFEKILERLEAAKDIPHDDSVAEAVSTRIWNKAIQRAKGIVQEVAKKSVHNTNVRESEWIPVSERVPDSDRYILVSFENFSVPCVGRYEEDDKGGAFYVGDDDIPLIAQGMIVNAWMELPKPYKGE